MSIVGLIFSMLYVLVSFLSFVLAYMAGRGGDHKGWFVFLQLPIALQCGLVDALVHKFGFKVPLHKISWFWAYVLFWVPTLCGFYYLGWLIEKLL